MPAWMNRVKEDTRMFLEVRCCCQPQKVLGYMQVTQEQIDRRRVVYPMLAPFRYDTSDLVSEVRASCLDLPIEEIIMTSSFQVGPINHIADEGKHLAIKAEGKTVEELSRCPAFTTQKPNNLVYLRKEKADAGRDRSRNR